MCLQSVLLFGTIILAIYVGTRVLGSDKGNDTSKSGRCVHT